MININKAKINKNVAIFTIEFMVMYEPLTNVRQTQQRRGWGRDEKKKIRSEIKILIKKKTKVGI